MEDIIGQLTNEKVNYEAVFEKCATKLIKNYGLKYGDVIYNFVELEFYFYDNEKHPDPYVHMNELQQKFKKFYYHGSGIDITFGNGTNYGGILIRGIKINNNEYINGPLNSINRIFQNQKITQQNADDLKLVNLVEANNCSVSSSTRVGLQVHPLDYEFLTNSQEKFKPYIFRLYRFIANFDNPQNKCRDKTKIQFYNHINDNVQQRPYYRQDVQTRVNNQV